MIEFTGIIDGAEWAMVAILAGGLLWGWYLVLSVQPDARGPEVGENDDNQAVEMFVRLVGEARRSIVIHDEGTDSPESVYNSDEVMEAVKRRIRERGIEVHCLFNDAEPLKLLDLAREDECRDRIRIWYARGERSKPDIHYKIVDGGKLVHVSNHRHHASAKAYLLYKAPWWARGARQRFSRAYKEHFERCLKNAVAA